MSTKIKPQVGVVYECYKGFTDSHGDRCRVGQKFIFKGGEAYENDDYYYMDKVSGRGAQIEIAKDKFASHFCPANCEQAKQESYIDSKPKQQVMINAIAITESEQIKALAIAIPSIKPQLQAQFPNLFITHKAGNRYENVDSGEFYILAHESNAVALVNLNTGTITSNTIHVDDIDNITTDEFARMVNNPSDYELV
jgi:hypothetical protein